MRWSWLVHATVFALVNAGLWLAGCANIAATPPGTPLSQLTARFGTPSLQCVDRQGRNRVVWSRQPLGQYAWGGHGGCARPRPGH